MELRNLLQDSLGDKIFIPFNTFFSGNNILSLADFINSLLFSENRLNFGFNGNSFSSSIIVELQKGLSGKIPIIFLHPVEGSISFYNYYAQQLGLDQPVYAFQAPSVIGLTEPYSNIISMASDYIDELLTHFTDTTTFILGGYSFGGVLAFEMAKQLKDKSYNIPMLALIDSPGPGFTIDKSMIDLSIMNDLSEHVLKTRLDNLPGQTLNQKLDLFYQSVKQGDSVLLNRDVINKVIKTCYSSFDAMKNYDYKIYNGNVMFFRHSENYVLFDKDVHHSWTPLVQGDLEIYQISGNHRTMNLMHNVKQICNIIRNGILTL